MATDPLQKNVNPPADPVNQLAPKPAGQPSHDDHDTGGPPSPETIKRGYEVDTYDVKTVLSVPALVVFFFVGAFGITTVLFTLLSKPIFGRDAHPQAAARNQTPLPDRLNRIGRGKEVDQPRLDQLDIRTGESRAITRPKAPVGNSPQVHPEDQDPARYPDRYRELEGGGPNKGGVPVSKALDADEAALKALQEKWLKSSKEAAALPDAMNRFVPTAANAGRVAAPAPTAVKGTDAPAPREGKKEEKK